MSKDLIQQNIQNERFNPHLEGCIYQISPIETVSQWKIIAFVKSYWLDNYHGDNKLWGLVCILFLLSLAPRC